ncbi:MAG: right-handed parallel beta-helix repeat-containing protein [Planctomycetota bacterium]
MDFKMKKLVYTLLCLFPVFTSQAALITVDNDGPADFDNIQDAIDSSENGDIIVVRTGTYNQAISFNDKSVTLTSEDPDDLDVVEATIITADSGYGVSFNFGEGHNSVLTGFTITGRGIYCFGSSPTVSKNNIRNCSGNGIQGEDNAAPVVSDNTITSNAGYGIYLCNGPIENNNISENKGGIAYCNGPITGNDINNNSGNSPGDSGGALSFCNGLITGNILADNYAMNKGGACHECTGNIIGNRIIGNTSQVNGGALSNCRGRIVNNIIAGNRSANGGGLFGCLYVYNNTIAGNIAEENGGALSQCPGNIRNNIIAFNSAGFAGGIYGAGMSSYNNFWSNQGGNFGGDVDKGPGDIIVEPLFVIKGYFDNKGTTDESDDFWVDGDYHIMSEAGRWSEIDQSWINDSLTSLCIDAGGEPDDPNSNWTAELWPHGKRINMGAYGGTVQASMSLSDAGNIADLDPDVNDANDWVDYNDMLLLTQKWLSIEVPMAEDLDRNGIVDLADYGILVNNWQPKIFPPEPPEPNPMTWAMRPQATSRTAIEMAATIAVSTDDSGVEYYFQSMSLGGHDSGWQEDPNYTDTGLNPGTEYSYIVKARNKENLAETDHSGLHSATTFPPDTTAPIPDPATWKTEPYVVSAGSILMEATTATDESGVEYFFTCTSNPAYSSNWQDDPVYQLTSLPKDIYSFVVKARDKSTNQNTTGDSTEVDVDLEPPAPDPMQWAAGGEPREIYGGGGTWDYYAEMTAAVAIDESGGVEYYFECSDDRYSSGGAGDTGGTKWRTERKYKVKVGQRGRNFYFKVKARDIYGNQTAYSSFLPAQ